jgi:hypothetical protein
MSTTGIPSLRHCPRRIWVREVADHAIEVAVGQAFERRPGLQGQQQILPLRLGAHGRNSSQDATAVRACRLHDDGDALLGFRHAFLIVEHRPKNGNV